MMVAVTFGSVPTTEVILAGRRLYYTCKKKSLKLVGVREAIRVYLG